MAGAMSMTGSPDGPPTKAIGGLADTGAGLHTAIGILAAIIQRHATGRGQLLEVAQQDSVVNLLRIHLRESYQSGKPSPRLGNRSMAASPSNIYRCRPFGSNDYVFVHCATVEMWKTLTKICGRPELGDDPRRAQRRDLRQGAGARRGRPRDAQARGRDLATSRMCPSGTTARNSPSITAAPARRTVTLTERFLPSVCSTVASASRRSPTTTGARNFAVAFAGTTVGSFTASIAA